MKIKLRSECPFASLGCENPQLLHSFNKILPHPCPEFSASTGSSVQLLKIKSNLKNQGGGERRKSHFLSNSAILKSQEYIEIYIQIQIQIQIYIHTHSFLCYYLLSMNHFIWILKMFKSLLLSSLAKTHLIFW